MMRRRDALILGSAIGVAVAIPPILRRLPRDFEFEPLRGAAGFRRLAGGEFSGGGIDPFFGLDAAGRSIPKHDLPLCSSLFGPVGWSSDLVPVAIFTDVNCPYCKVLEHRLRVLRDEGAPIRLIWHDLPLLGPTSVRSARAVLAARALGKSYDARAYVNNRVLRPGPNALKEMAASLGLDPETFVHRVESDGIERALENSFALGERLGIPGTPGTVVGRTLVIGAIDESDLKRLIEIERKTPQSICS